MKHAEFLPLHPNAENHRRVVAALEAATPAEQRAMLIAAGIMTPAGKLAEHYRARGRGRRSREGSRRGERVLVRSPGSVAISRARGWAYSARGRPDVRTDVPDSRTYRRRSTEGGGAPKTANGAAR